MVNNQSIRLYITEWKPPVNQGWQLNLFFLGFLLIPVLTAMANAKEPIPYNRRQQISVLLGGDFDGSIALGARARNPAGGIVEAPAPVSGRNAAAGKIKSGPREATPLERTVNRDL